MATHRRAWWSLPAWLGRGRADSDIQVSEHVHGDRHVVQVRLPDPSAQPRIRVSYLGGLLQLQLPQGEAEGGWLCRTVRLPNGARPDTITARYADGILEVSVQVGERVLPGRDVPVRRRPPD